MATSFTRADVARRRWLRAAALLTGTAATRPVAAAVPYPGEPHRHPPIDRERPLRFPRDFGAHPDFRTEWWYVTGWLTGQRAQRGFQVTFFRVRTAHPAGNPSRFAPTELVFAHAALMDPENGGPLHAQRAARHGTPGVECSDRDTDVRIGDWHLVRGADDRYHTVIREADFTLDLRLAPPGGPAASPWLQGEAGFSRKGPQPHQASRYYSRPQLRVTGTVDGRPVEGIAWFDHEWSTSVLDEAAAGWDWTGINLHDGSALVAFRIRPREEDDANGAATPLWRYCALRDADGRSRIIEEVRFEPLRRWQSPRSGARYPVAMRIDLPGRSLRLEPLMDDQELDGRASTGTIYWEGAVRVREADGRESGLGYLELTGYRSPIRL